MQGTDTEGDNLPLFMVDVEIQEGVTERLIMHEKDSVSQIISDFIAKHCCPHMEYKLQIICKEMINKIS